VLAWFSATEETQLHLSAVTIGEIQACVVTRNLADFKAFGVPLLDPFRVLVVNQPL